MLMCLNNLKDVSLSLELPMQLGIQLSNCDKFHKNDNVNLNNKDTLTNG